MAKIAPTFLHLNLTEQTFEVISYEELIPKVGGLGWALPLFEKFYDQDPKDAPIVFATGLLNNIFPGASKTVAVFKSPQTKGLMTSLGGGALSRFIRFSGYQGLVITGTARTPLLVDIEEERVEFEPANFLLGVEVPKAFEQIFISRGVPSRRSVAITGPAAEAGFTFSPLYIDEFFSFARGGLGGAFAAKNLKGLLISGGKSEEIANPRRYSEVFGRLMKKFEGYKELSRFGTLKNLSVEQKVSGVAFENLNKTERPLERLLAADFAGALNARRVSCAGCPVGCIHLLRLGREFTPYDYESVCALGPMLGLENPVEVGGLIKKAWSLGLDPTSLGVILAYVTEKENLKFGDFDTYSALISALVAGKESWVRELKDGLPEDDAALNLGGLEFLPYLNGYASILSQALRLGATTEENRGFILDLELIGKKWEPEDLVAKLVEAEKMKTLSELLVGCGYLSGIFEEEATAFAALDALEVPFSHEDLKRTAEEVFYQKIGLQRKLGFDPLSVTIPQKFFGVATPQGMLEEDRLKQMISIYAEEIFAPSI